ncbi:MAG: hypothetical protein HC912_11760, partial [Saprospiraceae bacterium]|nr:hypothetical protein [Saprospiraceae bacterium]
MKQVLFSLLIVLSVSIGYAQVPGGNKKLPAPLAASKLLPAQAANEL